MSINRSGVNEEAERVRRAQAGEAEAFDDLVEYYTPRLYRIIRRLTSDQSEAEAIVQEAWLRAWKGFPSYSHERPLFPWLARIALNVARDQWRKRTPMDFADLGGAEHALPDPGLSPEEHLTHQEAIERLLQGFKKLRAEHKTVIALRYDGGLSYEEIAEILDVPLNTVRTHLHRAKSALRRWMEVSNG